MATSPTVTAVAPPISPSLMPALPPPAHMMSPKLSPRRGPDGVEPDRGADLQRPSKRLRATASLVEHCTDLRSLLVGALPGKESFVADWLKVLASPSVCVTSLEDVRRLDPKDIPSLPIPPLVKGVFREVLDLESHKAEEQHLVLRHTKDRQRAFLAPLRDRHMQPPLAGSKYFQDLDHYRLILTGEEIQAGVRIVARRIETWSKGERVVLVAILKGAFMFLSDLCRTLSRPYSCYFVEASSYGNSRDQKGGVAISSDIASSKFFDSTTQTPHKIILIDELLDNGKTMEEMKQHFLTTLSATHTNNDILTVCLFSKKRSRTYPEADVTGIPNLPDLWLVGYGLDDRGTKRGWVELFAIPKVKIVETIDKQEVDTLLSHLDNEAVLTEPLIFAGVELQYNHKQKYRLQGLEVMTGGTATASKQLNGAMKPTNLKKKDVEQILSGCSTIKGKYEHELRFAFIPIGMSVVPEDEIFSGNNVICADMRCQLRKSISAAAQRFGVEGLAAIRG